MPKKNPHRAAIARRLHESPRRPILASKKKTGGTSLCPPDDGAGAKEAAKSLPSGRHGRADRKTVVVTRAVRQGTTMTDSPFDIEIPDDAKVDVTYEITKGENVIWMISIWTPGPEKRLVAKFVMTTQAIAKFMVFLSEMLDIEVEDALADWVALVVQTGDLRPLTSSLLKNLNSSAFVLRFSSSYKRSAIGWWRRFPHSKPTRS
jgi:hypothetical protein